MACGETSNRSSQVDDVLHAAAPSARLTHGRGIQQAAGEVVAQLARSAIAGPMEPGAGA